MQWIELDEGAEGLRPSAPLRGPKAWRAKDLSAEDWRVEMNDDALAELSAAIETLRRQQLPVCMLRTDMFALERCRAVMARIRALLDDGIGIALLDRLPVHRWSYEESRAAYWLLGLLLSQPVAQQWDGLIFRDIVDRGGDQKHGNERAVTNRVLTFHTDNSGNRTRPNYVGLLGLSAPRSGGQSRYCTLASVVNALSETSPALLDRLFEPFLHDRQGIQPPGETDVLKAPALSFDGERLLGRFSLNKIHGGYRNAAIDIDDAGRQALDAVVSAIDDHALACSFTIEPGQIQFLNNLEGLHHRCDYIDGPEPAQRRHLLRMWFRNHGSPFFDG